MLFNAFFIVVLCIVSKKSQKYTVSYINVQYFCMHNTICPATKLNNYFHHNMQLEQARSTEEVQVLLSRQDHYFRFYCGFTKPDR